LVFLSKVQGVLLIPGKLVIVGFARTGQFLFKDRLLNEAWQHGYEVEADIEALAEVV